MTHDLKNIINTIRKTDSCTFMEEIDRTQLAIDIIRQTPSSFKYADNKLKNDIELVLYVIKQDPTMYKYIGKQLKNNRELALCAIKGNKHMIKFIGNELKKDKVFIYTAMDINNIKGRELSHYNMKKTNMFNTDIKHEQLVDRNPPKIVEHHKCSSYNPFFYMFNTKLDKCHIPQLKCEEIVFMGYTHNECMIFLFGITVGCVAGYCIPKK